MAKGKTILKQKGFKLVLDRLAYALIENYDDFRSCCIIGIQEKGVILANQLIDRIKKYGTINQIEYGKLDITFYRDDFRRRTNPLVPNSTEVDFLVEGKKVLLIDDVLYTGRSVQAALNALQAFGRPKGIELLCMVDRRFNRHLPIQADYRGITVDAINDAFVSVQWEHLDGKDQILLYPSKNI